MARPNDPTQASRRRPNGSAEPQRVAIAFDGEPRPDKAVSDLVIVDPASLRDALVNAGIAASTVFASPAPEGGPDALTVIADGPDMAMDWWRRARRLVPVTGRWPVVTQVDLAGDELPPNGIISGGLDVGGVARHVSDTVLRRPYYDAMRPRAEVLHAAEGLDLDDALAARADARRDGWIREEPQRWAEFAAEETLARFGTRPRGMEVTVLMEQALRAHDPELTAERALFDWEHCHVPIDDLSRSFPLPSVPFHWYEGWPMLLLFLPTPHGWEAPAHLCWFGAETDTDLHVRAMRSWHDRYGAELRIMRGTDMVLDVAMGPLDHEEAWALAGAHRCFGTDTMIAARLPLRHYAWHLLHRPQSWYLYARP